MKQRRRISNSKCEIVIIGFVLAVVIGLCTAAYAVPPTTSNEPRFDRFDYFVEPFRFSRVTLEDENTTKEVGTIRQSLRKQVFVPRRPVCRSPIRPPLTF